MGSLHSHVFLRFGKFRSFMSLANDMVCNSLYVITFGEDARLPSVRDYGSATATNATGVPSLLSLVRMRTTFSNPPIFPFVSTLARRVTDCIG